MYHSIISDIPSLERKHREHVNLESQSQDFREQLSTMDLGILPHIRLLILSDTT